MMCEVGSWLFHQHLLLTFDRQLLLADLIGDLSWSYDLQAGILSFNYRFQWRSEILGTESEETQTWLWAWANEASGIPEQQQTASMQLRALGEEHGIPELTEPVVPLDHRDGHAFASLAVGEGLGRAYYRAPYEGGAAFLLITDEALQFVVGNPVQRVLTVFPQAISAMELPDHREALRGYLRHYGLKPEDENGCLVLRDGGEELLRAEFDNQNRLTRLTGTIRPTSPSPAPAAAQLPGP